MSTRPPEPAPAAAGSAAAPASRPRWRRWALGLGIAFIAICGVMAALRYYALVPYVRQTAIPRLEARYGIDIAESGMRVGLFSGELRVRHPRISQGDRTFLRARELRVKMDVSSFVEGMAVIDSLELRGLQVDARMLADGSYDIVSKTRSAVKEEVAAESSVPAAAIVLVVRELRIRDGQVQLSGEPGSRLAGYDYRATGLQVDAVGLQFSGEDQELEGRVRAETVLDVRTPEGDALHAGRVAAVFDLNRMIREHDAVFESATIENLTADLQLGRYGIPNLAAVFIPPDRHRAPEPPDPDPGPLVQFDRITIRDATLTGHCTPESPWDDLVVRIADWQVDAEFLTFHGPDPDPEAAHFESRYHASVSQRDRLLFDSGDFTIQLDFPKVLRGDVVLQQVRAVGPRMNLTLQDDGHLDLPRLLAGDFAPTASGRTSPPSPADDPAQALRDGVRGRGPRLFIADLSISDGVIAIDATEASPMQGKSLRLNAIELRAVTYHILGNGPDDTVGDLRLHAEVVQDAHPALLDLVAWGDAPMKPDASLQAYAVMTGFDLEPIPQLGWFDRAMIGGRILHGRAELRATAGTITEGRIIMDVDESGESFDMTFAGPIFSPTVASQSSMLRVLSLPVKRLGDVAVDSSQSLITGLAKAGAAVVDAGSALSNAASDLITGDDTPNPVVPESNDAERDAAAHWRHLVQLHDEHTQRLLQHRIAAVDAGDSRRLDLLKSRLRRYDTLASPLSAGADTQPAGPR